MIRNPSLELWLLALAFVGVARPPYSAVARPSETQQSPESRPRFPAILGLEPDPASEPRLLRDKAPQAALRVVRIAYDGAQPAPGAPRRSKEEARALAGALSVLLRSKNCDFAAVAREWSDDAASHARGGFAGTIRSRKDLAPLEAAAFQTQVWGVVGPFDLPNGFWIARRIPAEPIAYDEIIVPWAGCAEAPAGARDQPAALDLAKELWSRVERDAAAFDALLAQAKQSDPAILGFRAGSTVPVFRGELVEPLESLVWGLETGGAGGPVATPKGYLLVRRRPVEWVAFDSMRIQFAGAEGAPLAQVRTKTEAKAMAEALATEAKDSKVAFEKLAAKWSDDPNDKYERVRRNVPVSDASPAWMREVAKLAVGAYGVVESKFGYLVVRRVEREIE